MTKTSKKSLQSHFNNEAEQAILGAVLLDNHILDELAQSLSPADFYREAHAGIYSAMMDLYAENIGADFVSLSDVLRKRGILDKVGGLSYLAALSEAISTAAGWKHYTDLVRKYSIRRRLMDTCRTVLDACNDVSQGEEKLLELAEQQIFEIASSRAKKAFRPISEILRDSYKMIEGSRTGDVVGIGTGFADLDKVIAGLNPGELWILGGRPGMGKTALMLNMAYSVARCGTGVVVYSLEMTATQLGLRLISFVARVDAFRMRTGRVGEDDYGRMIEAANRVSELPLFIDDSMGSTILDLKAKIRRLQRKESVGLLFVDYLQLMSPSRQGDSREREVAELSAGLKAIGKDLNLAVIALSQLNRKSEDRPNRRPQLADLRDSGAIEQDADGILFLYRHEVYTKNPEDKGKAELIVAKSRNGPTGTIRLTFLDRLTKFESYVHGDG